MSLWFLAQITIRSSLIVMSFHLSCLNRSRQLGDAYAVIWLREAHAYHDASHPRSAQFRFSLILNTTNRVLRTAPNLTEVSSVAIQHCIIQLQHRVNLSFCISWLININVFVIVVSQKFNFQNRGSFTYSILRNNFWPAFTVHPFPPLFFPP